jgi:hypothetical protein
VIQFRLLCKAVDANYDKSLYGRAAGGVWITAGRDVIVTAGFARAK